MSDKMWRKNFIGKILEGKLYTANFPCKTGRLRVQIPPSPKFLDAENSFLPNPKKYHPKKIPIRENTNRRKYQ